MPSTQTLHRRLLVGMYDAAVAAAHPARCLPSRLPSLSPGGRLIVVGAGKAAAAMAVATEQHYAARGEADRISGEVVTRHGFALPTSILHVREAGHPVPDAHSAAAAAAARALVETAGPDDVVLCLLSGGASALWAAPAEGVSLDAKQELTRALLKAGARISEINCVRKHLSAIKGGRLARLAHPARLVTLAISDVPGDDPATIGSGPTVADPTTLAEARDVLARFGLTPAPEIMAALRDPRNETVKRGAAELASASYDLVATPMRSLWAAARVAEAAGYAVDLLGDALEGEARDVGVKHAAMALDARKNGRRVAILSGGELTVTVHGAGAGGPNQEYALALAQSLGSAENIWALAADTDGIDGGSGDPGDPAGAVVTPDTLARARAAGRDAAADLLNNDSTGFFDAVGDLVRCGPTQTNVNDFRAILVAP